MVDRNASRTLIEFIQSFSDLQEQHLTAIHKTMRETVDGVMAGIEEISKKLMSTQDSGTHSVPSHLDRELESLLLSMMGQLSRDDIIKQRVEHVLMSMQALQFNLTYILSDYEHRCSENDVQKFVKEMKSFALRTYTTEEERHLHFHVFQDDKPSKKKAS